MRQANIFYKNQLAGILTGCVKLQAYLVSLLEKCKIN